jgi:outer membrane lipopolysaccharide assembly protein LptE/RlpB
MRSMPRPSEIRAAWIGRRAAALLPVAAVLCLAACGYHLAGRSASLPAGLTRLAVPTFQNRTNKPQIEQRITEHVIDEMTTRGRLRIVAREEEADAVLRGEILSYTVVPVIISEQGRATRYESRITAHVVLSQIPTDRVLWEDNHFLFKGQYNVTATEQGFVDQETVAIDDVATDFARSVVTSILEGF